MDELDEKGIPGIQSAKRLGMTWVPWMGDWFASHSPRNGNSNAEGPWEHWVQLAVSILQHPATGRVRPDAHAAVQGLENTRLYTTTSRDLTDDEIATLFGGSDD